MVVLACIGVFVGELALLLDLGNRLFGSYVRTPIGSFARISLIVALALLLAAPLMWMSVDESSRLARALHYFAGMVGGIAFWHFFFPYRWHITAVPDIVSRSSCVLVPGIQLSEYELPVPILPASAQGMTILVTSDLHCNSKTGLALLRDAIGKLPTKPIDVVLHLGDFGENKSLLPDVISTLAVLRGRFGTFCVLGNHDYEGGRETVICDQLAKYSIDVLSNESRFIAKLDVSVLGLAYPWTRDPLPRQSHEGMVICLTHTPDNIVYFPELHVVLGFAGHTHGGKIRIPGFGAVLVPSKLGRFLTDGWFEYRDSLLYLTPGLGYSPGRLGNVGEFAIVTLKNTS